MQRLQYGGLAMSDECKEVAEEAASNQVILSPKDYADLVEQLSILKTKNFFLELELEQSQASNTLLRTTVARLEAMVRKGEKL